MYPRPKKKSAFKRFRENFELNSFLEVVVFIIALALLMFLFVWIMYNITGPTYGFL